MTTLLVFAAVLIFLLTLPWGIEFGSAYGERRLRLIVAGFRFKISPDRLRRRAARPEPESKQGASGAKLREFLELVEELNIDDLRSLIGARKHFFGALKFRVTRLELVVATPDPALTGMAYGLASAAKYCSGLPAWSGLYIDFESERPRAEYVVELLVRPVHLLWGLMRIMAVLALSRVVRWKAKMGANK